MSEIDRYTEQELKRLQTVLIRSLQYCGEQVLNKPVRPILIKTKRAT